MTLNALEWPDAARGVLASYDDVTPTRSDDSRRLLDIANIGFPLQVVIAIVTIAVTVYGTTWAAGSKQDAANAAMRTDIAVILQVQKDQSKVEEYKAQLEEANRKLLQQSIDAVKAELGTVRGQVQLANIEIGNVRREMNERGKR